MARDEHAAAWSEAYRRDGAGFDGAVHRARADAGQGCGSGTVSASGGAMPLGAKSRFSCESVERGMARSRVGCVAGFSSSKGRTTPSRPSGLSRGLLPRRAGPDAATPTEAITAEQIHDTQSPGSRASPCATRAQSTRPTIRPETPSASAGGGEGERSGSNLDAPGAPFAVLLGRPQRATFTASMCPTEPAASRISALRCAVTSTRRCCDPGVIRFVWTLAQSEPPRELCRRPSRVCTGETRDTACLRVT